MTPEDIKMEDYEAIAAYAGANRSWYYRLNNKANVDRMISFAEKIISMAIVAARNESKGLQS